MDSLFRFKQFSLHNEESAFKVGTDAVLLGACMTLLPQDRRLLDIGTGTGVIALLAAQRLSELKNSTCTDEKSFSIEAVEIDGASAREASRNFSESTWSSNLSVINCPFQDFAAAYMNEMEEKGEDAPKYDCIFSNPPYFDESLQNPDQRLSTARHTESLSYREICAFASKALRPLGRLAFVLPSDSEKALIRYAASYSLQLSRLLRIRTSQRKCVKRFVAEFLLCDRAAASPTVEEIDLQKPNPTTNFYL